MSESEPDDSIATEVTNTIRHYDKEPNPENVTWGFLTTRKDPQGLCDLEPEDVDLLKAIVLVKLSLKSLNYFFFLFLLL